MNNGFDGAAFDRWLTTEPESTHHDYCPCAEDTKHDCPNTECDCDCDCEALMAQDEEDVEELRKDNGR